MPSKRIVTFNHKGGVSKTTTVYNLAWKLSDNAKVLVVDADSQCNLTSLILGEKFDAYYHNEETKEQNIMNGVAPAFKGSPNPITEISCTSPQRNSNLFLLAGHPNLSEYDASLSFAQTSNNALATLQNLPGAFNRLIELVEEKYNIDYTLIDLNPSLSSINQNLFLSCDSFLVPTNPDPFSLMALDTLADVLPRWVKWKGQTAELFADSAYPMRAGTPKFCGTLIQRFNVRNGKAAQPYQNNISDIEKRTIEYLFPKLTASDITYPDSTYAKIQDLVKDGYSLAKMPDFQGLLPKSHSAGVPVFTLTSEDIGESGNVLGGMVKNRDKFDALFSKLSTDIITLIS